jgi:hypothetical protein
MAALTRMPKRTKTHPLLPHNGRRTCEVKVSKTLALFVVHALNGLPSSFFHMHGTASKDIL